MGRFEREDTEATSLSPSIGTATEGLRSTIESELARIVEGAQARAAEIEEQALEKAARIEQNSERRAQELFRDGEERVAQLLGELDAIEQVVNRSLQTLRAETELLAAQLSGAPSEAFELEARAPDPAPDHGEDRYERAPDRDYSEVRGMVRQQLLAIAEQGGTRAEAERMLVRFRLGEQYYDLLDEIDFEESPRRRGLFRRIK